MSDAGASLTADGETEAQNGFVVLQGHRVRTVSSFRSPTSGAQPPYLPRIGAGVGWGCSGTMLQRLQSTAVAGGWGPRLEMMTRVESWGEPEEPPGTRAPW